LHPVPCSFIAPATPESYTLSLHDALPISGKAPQVFSAGPRLPGGRVEQNVAFPLPAPGFRGQVGGDGHLELHAPHRLGQAHHVRDRKSTRLNSSHVKISYAVFCLKKKKEK